MRFAASARAVVLPKAKPARDKHKELAEGFCQTFWGGGDADPKPLSVSIPIADAKVTKAYLASLNPTTKARKQAVAAATRWPARSSSRASSWTSTSRVTPLVRAS